MDQSRQRLRFTRISSPTSQVTHTVYLTCISNTGNFEFTVYEDFLTYKSGNTLSTYLTCISNTGNFEFTVYEDFLTYKSGNTLSTSPVYQIEVTLSLQSTRTSSPTSQVTHCLPHLYIKYR